ncbi:MAG: D-glycero-beta-D-manno-heptose 1-phosphate adenylyltransferase [bacterium]
MKDRRPMAWDEAVNWRKDLASRNKSVVFTNGVFDILHSGHVDLLERCREEGDALIVGVNSDASVRLIKGERRPIVPEGDRAAILLGLRSVDAVVFFDEETPAKLIDALAPDVLIKGGDYTPDKVVGRESVEHAGGRLVILPLVGERSTTNVVETILERYCDKLREGR